MTGAPFPPGPDLAPHAEAGRPPTLVALVVLVLAHAALLCGSTVVSVLGLTAFALGHPGFASSPQVLVPVVLLNLLGLALAAGDVVLGVRAWLGARRTRVPLSVCLGLAWVLDAGGTVASTSRSATPSGPLLVGLLLCTAALVLLWLPSTSRWFRGRAG